MWHLSGSQWVLYAVFEVLWAVVGYWLSENARRRYGRTPWGLSSWVWALFWVLQPILGFVLFLIAHLTGARRTQQHPPVPGRAHGGGSGVGGGHRSALSFGSVSGLSPAGQLIARRSGSGTAIPGPTGRFRATGPSGGLAHGAAGVAP